MNPVKWIRRIFEINDEELKAKCGLDGYFFIRLLRAMIIIFVPLMVIIVTILLPINYNGGAGNGVFRVGATNEAFNVTGLDTLSWQNIAPTNTNRYWAHLICAILAISWTLYRMYREKTNFIDVRQQFLTSPAHRLKASSRTVLITNIPSEYRSKEALEELYDVFVDNDDHSRLTVWVNRDYGSLRALVARRRNLRHVLEKEELRILRLVNKKYQKGERHPIVKNTTEKPSSDLPEPAEEPESDTNLGLSLSLSRTRVSLKDQQTVSAAYEADCLEDSQLWHKYLDKSIAREITLVRNKDGHWQPARAWASGEKKKTPKIPWLRAEIADLNIQIEELLQKLDDEELFKKQNSAFIQFDRQMSAHMACSLTSHSKAGRMSPRYIEVSPHEIIWSNMGVTSLQRLIRSCIALVLFVGMLVLWALPTTVLGFLSQLDSLRSSTSWLYWLQPWPPWIISLISGKWHSKMAAASLSGCSNCISIANLH